VAKRRHVALLLQLEAHLIDAARGIDCKHQREIDRLAAAALRRGRTDGDEREDKREKDRERAPGLFAAVSSAARRCPRRRIATAATRCIATPA
jgi:hypothetical protein